MSYKITPILFFLIIFSNQISAAPNKNSECAGYHKAIKTKLIKKESAPQGYSKATPPDGVQEITYQSGKLELKAWVSYPKTSTTEKIPAIVYLHGGFAFGPADFRNALPFKKAGFAVMTPMLRGENGLPGHFEMFGGEVSDAVSAVNWLSTQPRVDPNRIYVFGHSIGGGISALISLRCDAQIKLSGSSGGIYTENTFRSWYQDVPFMLTSGKELRNRILFGRVKRMAHKHIAYIGESDGYKYINRLFMGERQLIGGKVKLEILSTKGDHSTSLKPSIENFIERIHFEEQMAKLFSRK